MTKYIYIISAALAILSMSSCQHDDDGPAVLNERFKIWAYLGDDVTSRTVPRDDDGFSVAGFTNGDQAGFFSETGDRNNGNSGFENSRMTFNGGYFVGDEGMSADINGLGQSLLYYPYSGQDYGRQPIRKNNPGAVPDPETDEVNDILVSLTIGNPEGDVDNAIVARFDHLFAMFAIEGGEGFKDFYKNDVSVTLTAPVETIEFRPSSDPANKYGYDVVLNGEYKDNGTTPDESFATVVGHYNKQKERYFVVIPVADKLSVVSINVYDDSGRQHKIKWSLKQPAMGKRYPLTLEMDELVPTIRIHDITLWDSDKPAVDLDANEEKGINDAGDFYDWLSIYNKNHEDDGLLRFGDKIQVTDAQGEPTGETYWRFYLTADIDMANQKWVSEVSHLVDMLDDEFDGCGYTISNLSFVGKSNAALFNVVKGKHACVKNLVVDNMNIVTTGSNPVGVLATEFNSGLIKDCSFTNLNIEAKAGAGALAGLITGGDAAIVQNCKFSGTIFGSGTVDKVAGGGSVSADVKKACDTSNVMFGNI